MEQMMQSTNSCAASCAKRAGKSCGTVLCWVTMMWCNVPYRTVRCDVLRLGLARHSTSCGGRRSDWVAPAPVADAGPRYVYTRRWSPRDSIGVSVTAAPPGGPTARSARPARPPDRPARSARPPAPPARPTDPPAAMAGCGPRLTDGQPASFKLLFHSEKAISVVPLETRGLFTNGTD